MYIYIYTCIYIYASNYLVHRSTNTGLGTGSHDKGAAWWRHRRHGTRGLSKLYPSIDLSIDSSMLIFKYVFIYM